MFRMASHKAPFCSDEELLHELKKLGYNDVPADVFLMMKDDLSELVSKDPSLAVNSTREEENRSFGDTIYSNQRNKLNPASKSLHKYQLYKDSKLSTILDDSSPISDISVDDAYRNSLKSFNTNKGVQSQNFKIPEETDTSSDIKHVSDSHTSSDTSIGDVSFSKYHDSLKNFKAGRQVKSRDLNALEGEDSSNSSSVSIEGNRIKRKILRHKNGKPVISEEFIEIPGIFNTSYPETENSDLTPKSISSDDLSFKSNSSTGSLSALSPDTTETPRSTMSLSSTRSSQSRMINQRKKKSDPVAMYNYYKKFWNDFKPPGEKTHDKLRWAVRDKMLDYTL